MIRSCEIDIINIILNIISKNKIILTSNDIDRYKRSGSEKMYYLNIFLKKKLDMKLFQSDRYTIFTRINGKFHPFEFVIKDTNYVQLEKWDESESIPENDQKYNIEIISVEPAKFC